VYHPLSERDRATVAAMRVEAAPFKGKMSDPSARGAFDTIMEHTPEPAGVVTYENAVLGGVNGVWCVPHGARPAAAILYLHGGAYLLGSARGYRHFVGQFAARTSTRAFIADYRLAPEYPFPAALDDARAAYGAIVAAGAQQLAIVGDSAGGGPALALLSVVQGDAGCGVAPTGAVVMSPWTDLALTGTSMLRSETFACVLIGAGIRTIARCSCSSKSWSMSCTKTRPARGSVSIRGPTTRPSRCSAGSDGRSDRLMRRAETAAARTPDASTPPPR
jgi:acetyl esterase/lipase